jgi:hypothetical protein
MNLYINGQAAITKTDSVQPVSKAYSCFLGKEDDPTRYLSGEVSSLKIYSGAMTPAQVTAAYDAALFSSLLQFHWDFTVAVGGTTTYTDSVKGILATMQSGNGGAEPQRSALGVVLVGEGPMSSGGGGGFLSLALSGEILGGPMTVVGVVKWSTLTFASRIFYCGNIGPSDSIVIANDAAAGKLDWSITTGVGGGVVQNNALSVASALVINIRYHIVTTVSSLAMTTYIDGVEVAKTTSTDMTPNRVARTQCYIGKSPVATNAFFSGEVSSLKIYSDAMTQAQVTMAFSAHQSSAAQKSYVYTSATTCTHSTNMNAPCCGTKLFVIIDSSVIKIAPGAFKMCTSIIDVDFTSATSLESIGASAFEGMVDLTTVNMAGATLLASVGVRAFNGCAKLASVKLASTTVSIGAQAFMSTLLSVESTVDFNTVQCASGVFSFVCPTWTRGVGGGVAWAVRYDHAAVCFDDGAVVSTGGRPNGGGEVHTMPAGGTTMALVTQSTFTERHSHAIARVPGNANDFLVVAGQNAALTYLNDALLTTDRGTTFTIKSAAVFTGPRSSPGLVAIQTPASFVAFGGLNEATEYNEIRKSVNSGVTWTTIRADGGLGNECASSPLMWDKRVLISYAYMPLLGRILVTGGKSGTAPPGGTAPYYFEDVWGSDDGGVCWTKHSSDANGAATLGYAGASLLVVTLAGLEIPVLAGGVTLSGVYLNTVSYSIDGGKTWSVTASSGTMWPARAYSAVVLDPANARFAIMGGKDATKNMNDVWTASAATVVEVVRCHASSPLLSVPLA